MSKNNAVAGMETSGNQPVSTPNGNRGSADLHLRRENIDGLIQKIIEAISLDERITWSWGIISECQVLTAKEEIKVHLEQCEHCRVYVQSRKSLAEQVIKAGRV